MMTVDIDVSGDREVIDQVTRMPNDVRDAAVQALRRGTLRIHSAVVAEELRGGTLNARTGNLSRAIFWRVEVTTEAVIGRVGVDLAKAIYGRVQALGGRIVPKRAQHLTIPVGQALTGNGVARFTARELLANPKAYGFRGAFVNPRKTAILGVNQDRSLEPLFALKTSVTIPPRNYLRRGLDRVRSLVIDDIRAAVRTALRKA